MELCFSHLIYTFPRVWYDVVSTQTYHTKKATAHLVTGSFRKSI